ncbi:MAG: hypothetical protein K6U88_01880, partial [Dehalococcoidia bacterium]|nr:hypothetical protein [Dehalococcoidia bacterium]
MLDAPARLAGTAGGAAWTRKDLLDTDSLSREEIELVLETARGMKEVRSRPVAKVPTLRGVTVATLFYEQSTRTRASFEVAAKSLGADVVNLTASGSSVEKGESLIDTVRTLEAIGTDVIVMRHFRSGAPYLAARHTGASIINGGDGTHAHPTQALLDVYTLIREFGQADGLHVCVMGDLKYGRTVHSLLQLLTCFRGIRVTLLHPPSLGLPQPLYLKLQAAGLRMDTGH